VDVIGLAIEFQQVSTPPGARTRDGIGRRRRARAVRASAKKPRPNAGINVAADSRRREIKPPLFRCASMGLSF